MNLPNRLTVLRIIMTAVFVALMSFENFSTFVLAYAVFTVASITDYYDGKIARERNIVTNFGKLLDPVADKVLLCAGFVMLMTIDELRIPGWAIVAIIGREFLITGGRALAASEGVVLAANRWGKFKTIFQMVYIFTFLFLAILLWPIHYWLPEYEVLYRHYVGQASCVSIIGVSALTVYSGIQFTVTNIENLKLGDA